jgi:arsenate reductase
MIQYIKGFSLSTIEIWHNNRCSKSRAAFNYLKEHDYSIVVREYLKELPSREELQLVLTKLNSKPSEIIRKKEKLFRELNLKDASEEELLEAMIKHPKLIERPIVVRADRAIIARPLELIEEIL